MKQAISLLAAVALLAACTTTAPEKHAAAEPAECTENVYTTGSMISKRQKCAPPASDEDRDRSQDAARAMRDEQIRRGASRSAPGGI